MTDKNVDYIIVGQGLAGSCLALQLLFRHKRVLVIDRVREHAATRVAAGLFNPVTGRQMTKTWMADALFPYLHSFYAQAELLLQSKFFFPMPLYRPFISIEEQNEWMGRSSDADYSRYIEAHTHSSFAHQVKNPLGGLLLKQCGYIDTTVFSDALRDYLKKKDALLNENLHEHELKIDNNAVTYRNWRARKIIFCTGEMAKQTSFFSWLPIRPLKGETLTIATDEPVEVIYNRGVYVVPHLWKVGATYNTHDASPSITEVGRVELTEKLNDLIAFPYSVVNQQWAFRPTTPDRRPILGSHPAFEQIVIFNGLGTKGVSLAPYFSDELTRWMENGHPLDQSVDINRYKSLFSKSA